MNLRTVFSQAHLVLQEILDEVVRELHKVKDEIIYGKRCSDAPAVDPRPLSKASL